jgi:malonate decarboxylase beta subunit
MSDDGRLAMSGPEVIEASHGVEEFDARDRALVWRTTGGKHRWLCGDCDALVDDDVHAFRDAALVALSTHRPVTLESLQTEHRRLADRLDLLPEGLDGDIEAVTLWQRLGIAEAARVPALDVDAVRALRTD